MLVVAIGGSASVGKTTASVRVADLLRLSDIVHVDDVSQQARADGERHFLNALEHRWLEPAELLTQRLIEWTRRLHPRITAAVGSLPNGGIVEGEGVDPRVTWPAFVSPVYVIETDANMLWQTFASRTSSARFLALTDAEQQAVVEMNRRYGAWLRTSAEARDQPWVPSQPLDTLPERIVEATIIPATNGATPLTRR
jgi:hypothetical protein